MFHLFTCLFTKQKQRGNLQTVYAIFSIDFHVKFKHFLLYTAQAFQSDTCYARVQNKNSHFSVIKQHPIHGFNGSVCCLLGLKVNKAIAFGSSLITDNLQNKTQLWRLSTSYNSKVWTIHRANRDCVLWLTLQDKILPKAEKVSYSALLSIESSMFLIKMLPTPDFRRAGSRWDHIIRIGRPLMTS